MIVDDEEPVLDSFSFILEKDSSDFTLCGKARSGFEAIRLMDELAPDVVFMDIQMPGISGIDTIHQVRERFPDTVFVLATAYERFDIARKAIPLGVFSYMIKPISRRKFLEELEKVKIHLNRARKRDEGRLEELRFLQKTKKEEKIRFLSSLLWKNPLPEEWEGFSRLFLIDSDHAALYLLGSSGRLAENLRRQLYQGITEKIQYKYITFAVALGDKQLFLFPGKGELENLNRDLSCIIEGLSPYSFVLGAGGVYHYSQLMTSVSEAFKPFADAAERDHFCRGGQARIHALCDSLLKAERAAGEEQFRGYWIEQFNQHDFDVAKGKMVALFTLLMRNMDTYTLGEGGARMDPAEEIMPLGSLEDWQRWASTALMRLYNLLDFQKAHAYPEPLKKALLHIGSNYQKPIQLSSVAEDCGVTGSYLSRLFSEHLGIKFIDYLNRHRLNAAMILLRDKNISIKETSYRVGYRDPNYFSRIFRRYLGVSPSDLEKREGDSKGR